MQCFATVTEYAIFVPLPSQMELYLTATPALQLTWLFAATQVLLVVSGGTNVARLPVMSLAFFIMLKTWLRSVKELATFSNCSMTHVEDTVEETAFSDLDRSEGTNDGNSAATPALLGQ